MKDLWTKEFTLKNDPSKKYKMTPCYKIEPRFERRPNGGERPWQRSTTLQQTISDIANASIPDEVRKEKMQKILNEFASSALIRTVSADGKVPYNRPYDIQSYFNRILKSRDIININIKNIRKNDSGKIILLELHEVYKEN